MRIGAMTRPWNAFTLIDALDGIQAAGFDSVGFLKVGGETVVDGTTPPSRVDQVKGLCADRGLAPLMVLSRGGAEAELIAAELQNLSRLGGEVLMHCGIGQPERYDALYAALKAAAPVAGDLGVRLVLKPHGGISSTAKDCVRALEIVDHPAFGIWYDPGNIQYYTGDDPVADVDDLVGRVSGCCVKDCTGSHPAGNGAVNLLPGDGEVDLATVFGKLLSGGFDGPCHVECLGGETLDEVNANAITCRQRLRAWLGC